MNLIKKMKPKTILSYCIFVLILNSNCKKDDTSNELVKLPEATSVGANTFGCLVNGKAYLPQGSYLSPPELQVFYQQLINGDNLSIKAYNKSDAYNNIQLINLSVDSLNLKSGVSLNLKLKSKESAFAEFDFIAGSFKAYSTTIGSVGNLTITNLNESAKIISGTFFFNAVTSTNDTVKVTNGRFDLQYK